jgi:hypothetical protein
LLPATAFAIVASTGDILPASGIRSSSQHAAVVGFFFRGDQGRRYQQDLIGGRLPKSTGRGAIRGFGFGPQRDQDDR